MKGLNIKFYIVLVLIILMTLLTGCSKNDDASEFIEYDIGDEVIIDGIIYQYVDFMDRESKYKPFSFNESSEDDIIHTFYYYDMSNENQAQITGYDLFNLHDIKDFDMIFKATDPKYNFQSDQYFPLQMFLYTSDISGQCGFVVKGYTDKIKQKVTIIDSIDRNPVVAIGYKALSGAKMESLIIEPIVAVLPYAISDCENLKTIDFEISSALLSCAIANNPNLTNVTKVDRLSDACLYNLEKLTEVEIVDVLRNFPTAYTFFHSGCLNLPNINKIPSTQIYKYYGVYKAPFYLCGNLTSFTGNVIVRGNVVHIKDGSYASSPIYVMNDFEMYLEFGIILTGMANHEEKTIIPNVFITGYPVKGTISKGEYAPELFEIEGKMYFSLRFIQESSGPEFLENVEDVGPYLVISDLTNFYK